MDANTIPAPHISDGSLTILDVITDGWFNGFTKTYDRKIQKVIVFSTHAGKPNAFTTSVSLPPWSFISVISSGALYVLCGFIDDNGNFVNRRIKHLISGGSTLKVTWEASTSASSTADNCRVIQMTMVI